MAKRKNLQNARTLERRGAFRSAKARVLVLVEGEVTEKDYFQDLKAEHRNTLLAFEIESPSSDPLKLVKEAVTRRNDAEKSARRNRDVNLKYEQVWCVFDGEEHETLSQAMTLAAESEVFVAMSNPCFELWLLLHFTPQDAYIERRLLPDKLRPYLPNYAKHLPDCSPLTAARSTAVDRADRLYARHEADGNPGTTNPSTGMGVFIRSVDALAASFSAERSTGQQR